MRSIVVIISENLRIITVLANTRANNILVICLWGVMQGTSKLHIETSYFECRQEYTPIGVY